MDEAAGTERPWAQGIGLLVLGLAISAVANVSGQLAESALLRALGILGYLAGLFVSGTGIHRILWAGPSARSRATRVLVTVLVTIPAFLVSALVLTVLLTVFQRRFMF